MSWPLSSVTVAAWVFASAMARPFCSCSRRAIALLRRTSAFAFCFSCRLCSFWRFWNVVVIGWLGSARHDTGKRANSPASPVWQKRGHSRLIFGDSAWGGRGDDQGHVGQGQESAGEEFDPIFRCGSLFEEAGDAGDDENEVADAADCHHYGIGAGDVPSVQEKPDLARASLEEMCDEQAEAVPRDRDDRAGAQAPRAVSTCQDQDGDIDQGLKDV